MQALIRPWPGWTWLQNRAMSGLHALRTACAPGRICAIAFGVESNKTAPVVAMSIFDNMIYPPSPWLERKSVGAPRVPRPELLRTTIV
jgi:hypothetical protein